MTVTETVDAGPYALSAGNKERWQLQWKELYDEVITSGLCTGCAGLRHRLPARRHRLRARTRRLQAVPPRGGARARRLHPRPEGLHLVHPGLPSLPGLGAQADEHLFARVRQPEEAAGIYQDVLLTRASDDMVHQMGQDGGLVSALLIWALDKGYIDAALTSYLEGPARARSWKAGPRRGHHQGGGARRRRVAVHLLSQHARPPRGARAGLLQARPRRDELPVVGAAGDVEPQDRQGRQADRLQHRPALLEDASTTRSSRSCS